MLAGTPTIISLQKQDQEVTAPAMAEAAAATGPSWDNEAAAATGTGWDNDPQYSPVSSAALPSARLKLSCPPSIPVAAS